MAYLADSDCRRGLVFIAHGELLDVVQLLPQSNPNEN
jgi:hypothetical protein